MKTAAVAAVAMSIAGLAAANPVPEPQGWWWGRRPGATATATATAFTTVTVPAGGATGEPVESPKPAPGGGSGGNGGNGGKWPSFPFVFTSTYAVVATPDQVINGTVPTPGEPGAIGYYNYGINSALDVICYNITLMGVTGPYQSLALTATHIHQGAKGATGPPRIALPNPGPVSDDPKVVRRSVGCMTGPFLTGILSNGVDTGTGFKLSQIEANPAGFFTDAHTSKYVPGVVRGQLA